MASNIAHSINFKSGKIKNVENLKIVHWNCNSIGNKKELLGEYLHRYKPHIVSLNETKLDVYEANLVLRFTGYESIIKSRSHAVSSGGGVAILVRSNIEYSIVKNYECFDIELVAVKLSLHGKNVIAISLYNLPTCSIESGLWTQLQNSKEDFILCRDLNCRSKIVGCAGSNKNGEILEDIILENDFVVLNDSSPTFNRNDY
jgi:hypothetical protein